MMNTEGYAGRTILTSIYGAFFFITPFKGYVQIGSLPHPCVNVPNGTYYIQIVSPCGVSAPLIVVAN